MGSNLHPSLAENLHPSLAEDLAAGAGGAYNPFVDIPNLIHGFRADVVTLGTPPAIAVWDDQVGSWAPAPGNANYDSADADAGGQPTVLFNEISSAYRLTEITGDVQTIFGGSAAWAMLWVAPNMANSLNHRAFTPAAGASPVARIEILPSYGFVTVNAAAQASNFPHGETITANTLVIGGVSYNGAGSARFVTNGVLTTAAATHRTLAGLDRYDIGNRVGLNAAINALAEIFICNGTLTDADLSAYYQYALARYT